MKNILRTFPVILEKFWINIEKNVEILWRNFIEKNQQLQISDIILKKRWRSTKEFMKNF